MRRVARAAIAVAIVTAWLVADTRPAFAYLKLGAIVHGTPTAVKWSTLPVRYYVSDYDIDHVRATDLQAAASRAFATWEAVPTSRIAYTFAGYTSATPLDEDGETTLGFVNQPSLDRVLATTSFTLDDTTGALVEADIIFNAAFPWSVAAAGEDGRYDVQSIALHEIGHLSGLGHSALGETELRSDGTRRVIATSSVMFPIAFTAGNIAGRTLRDDDVAGISDLYQDGGFAASTGSISGRVTRNGAGAFGAHVVAFNPQSGALVANFSLNASGQFSIAGLKPGPWVVRVEPLDDADVPSFFDAASAVELRFVATFFDRLVVVPRGADSGAIEVKVTSR